MLPQLTKLGRLAVDLLFPQWCVGCRKEGGFICSSCLELLSKITSPICPRCGIPQAGGKTCSDCKNLKAIDGIRSPFKFEGVMRQAIHQLKYGNIRALMVPLGKLLYDFLVLNPIPGEVLVPVPLHPGRLRERGYNQSSLLARELSKLTGLPLLDDCLVRLRHTPPQAKTPTGAERRSNVESAFSSHDGKLRGKGVVLVDDVSTSGATLDACAQALKVGGVTSVWGLTLAREV